MEWLKGLKEKNNHKGVTILMDNIRVLYVDMPIGYRAFTMPKDDFYTIYLNSRYSREQNISSLEHELRHIKNGDYEKECSVNILETNAHRAEF